MDFVEGFLYALIPALTWGSLVLVSEKLGGNSYNQTLGITIGSLLFAIVMSVINPPEWTSLIWIVGIISGIGWAFGQLFQFNSVKEMGVSKTVPISTGLQILGNTFFAVIVFKEWNTTSTIILGVIAIIFLIAGVLLTSYEGSRGKNEGSMKKGILYLIVSTLGFVTYVIVVRWFDIDGWSAILPQAFGMFIAAFLLSIKHKPFNKYAGRNILTGIMWATGNIGLLLANPKVGVAIAFSFSQMGIVISTLGGIFLLGEKKSKKQMTYVIIGCILVIAGGVMIGFTKE
ncbi:GRP family sugar transporter [Peribacillus sp. NPDC097284]|uniref:GRP family sugar transporter n=1 Tax=Peribacillus sp. NPDC097284 TaxID=3364401 RepID=UPI00381C7BFD